MGNLWLKLWTEIIHDRKLTRVSPTWRWAWIGLLALAAETDDSGKLELSPGVPLTDDDFIAELAIDRDDWRQAKAYFLGLRMLQEEDETLTVTKFKERQEPVDLTNAERQQRYRNRNRNASHNALRNGVSNALPVTPLRNTEVEVEVEVTSYSGKSVEIDLDEAGIGSRLPARVVQAYESGIGLIASPLLDGKLQKAVRDYGETWVVEAIEKAALVERPSWAYAAKVLNNWQTEGRSRNGHKPAADKPAIVLPPLPDTWTP